MEFLFASEDGGAYKDAMLDQVVEDAVLRAPPPMKYRSFQCNFHDSQLARFEVGPGRELTLEVALDPVWNKEAPLEAIVRFGGIENFDEVALYFGALPPTSVAGSYIAEIIALQHLGEGPNWVILDLAGHGHIKIQSQHVTES